MSKVMTQQLYVRRKDGASSNLFPTIPRVWDDQLASQAFQIYESLNSADDNGRNFLQSSRAYIFDSHLLCSINKHILPNQPLSARFVRALYVNSFAHSFTGRSCMQHAVELTTHHLLLVVSYVCLSPCRDITASQGTHKRASCSIPCNLHLLNVMRPWLCLLSQIFMKEKMGRGIQGKIQIISFLFPSCFALQGVMIRFQQLLVASLG